MLGCWNEEQTKVIRLDQIKLVEPLLLSDFLSSKLPIDMSLVSPKQKYYFNTKIFSQNQFVKQKKNEIMVVAIKIIVLLLKL